MMLELLISWESIAYFIPIIAGLVVFIRYLITKEATLKIQESEIFELFKVAKDSKKMHGFYDTEIADLVKMMNAACYRLDMQASYLKLLLDKAEIPYPEIKKNDT